MGAKFFSQRTSGRSVDPGGQPRAPEIALDGRDHQQALVLSALRRAAGAPVSYAELRAAGVELPASVVSELELAGVAIERCSGDGRAVGVRLDPDNDPASPRAPDPAPAMTTDPALMRTSDPAPPRMPDPAPPRMPDPAPPRMPDPAPPRMPDPAPPRMPDPAPPATVDPMGSTPMRGEHEPAWGGIRRYRTSSIEGFFLTVLGWLSWPTRKGDRPERGLATGRSRTIAAHTAVATRATEASVVEVPVKANRKRRVLAVTALVAGVAVVFVLGAMWAAGGGRGTRAPIAKGPRSRVAVTATAARQAPPSQSTHPSPPPPRVPVSSALATELEAQGHGLLEAGQYDAAVPVLKRAVLATGETLTGCLEPASSTCLTYAYALYDLGRAVRLSGEPQAAVPILERRLQIDNQRGVVSAELQLARQGIS